MANFLSLCLLSCKVKFVYDYQRIYLIFFRNEYEFISLLLKSVYIKHVKILNGYEYVLFVYFIYLFQKENETMF